MISVIGRVGSFGVGLPNGNRKYSGFVAPKRSVNQAAWDFNTVARSWFSLPILAVDDPIYRRLPCFAIATVDKFAGLPWVGQVGAFFGRVTRYDPEGGFFGPCDAPQGAAIPGGRLLPPDLVIHDELHLISGPLGTMVGLYETALETLSVRQLDGVEVRPKIIAFRLPPS